jgi:hypothetical protein
MFMWSDAPNHLGEKWERVFSWALNEVVDNGNSDKLFSSILFRKKNGSISLCWKTFETLTLISSMTTSVDGQIYKNLRNYCNSRGNRQCNEPDKLFWNQFGEKIGTRGRSLRNSS